MPWTNDGEGVRHSASPIYQRRSTSFLRRASASREGLGCVRRITGCWEGTGFAKQCGKVRFATSAHWYRMMDFQALISRLKSPHARFAGLHGPTKRDPRGCNDA